MVHTAKNKVFVLTSEGVLRCLHKLKIETVVMLPRPPCNHDLANIVTTEHASL